MGMLIGAALLFFVVSALAVSVLFHLILSLPLWLLVGGVVFALWLRGGPRRRRYLGRGRPFGGYLHTDRW